MTTAAKLNVTPSKGFIATANAGRLRIACPDRAIEVDYPNHEMAERAFDLVDRIADRFHYAKSVEVFGKPHSREEFLTHFLHNLPHEFYPVRQEVV
jgi:hypothetical protein